MNDEIINLQGEIAELLYGYGYEVDFKDPKQMKVRFSSENGFIDVWNGKKGITFGAFEPKKKKVVYEKFKSIEKLEALLIKIK